MKNKFNEIDFNEFKNIVMNSKLTYEEWLKYYYTFLEVINFDIKDFDCLTIAIYLKHAIILPFANYDEEQKYNNQLSFLETYIEQTKVNNNLKR